MTSRTGILAVLAVFGALTTQGLVGISAEPPEVKTLMETPLPDFPGKETTMIEVRFPPGAEDPIHRHDAHAFVYVLEGEIEMQLQGADAVRLGPGDTFYEDPKAVHLVGRNLSETSEARFIVFLIKDRGAPILKLVDD